MKTAAILISALIMVSFTVSENQILYQAKGGSYYLCIDLGADGTCNGNKGGCVFTFGDSATGMKLTDFTNAVNLKWKDGATSYETHKKPVLKTNLNTGGNSATDPCSLSADKTTFTDSRRIVLRV